MNLIRRSVWALGLILFLSACGIKVGVANPTPNVDMDETDKTLAITIDPSVLDTFEVPASHGMAKTIVESWRASLTAGVANGFGPYFKAIGTEGDYTIRIKRAEMEFAPAAVHAGGGVVAATAQITYQARLLDSKGETLARSGGTVTAKKAIMGRAEATDNAADAIATMVEKMAADFFEKGLPTAKSDDEDEDEAEKKDDDEGEKKDDDEAEKKDDEEKKDDDEAEKKDDEEKKDDDAK